jgi:hypothetical protein
MKLEVAIGAVVLLALVAGPVAADHGYWPPGGGTPAVVTGHEEATEETMDPSHWGSNCRTVDNGGSVADGGLDTYGALLVEDYDLVVIVAGNSLSGPDRGWLEGPNGITVFGDPEAGEFVWADADGNGQFANTHEVDASLMFQCSAMLPRTDTALEHHRISAPAWLAVAAAFLLAAVAVVRRLAAQRRIR